MVVAATDKRWLAGGIGFCQKVVLVLTGGLWYGLMVAGTEW